MEKKEKRRLPRFYKIYFISLAVTVAVIAAACVVLRSLLREYEAAQPKYEAAAVFEEYFDPIDYDRLLGEAEYDAGLASGQAVREYLAGEVGQEELSWSLGSSGSADEVNYMVKAGRTQIGTICLTASGETKHGFPTYALSRVELALNASSIPGGVVTVTAPAGCVVALDGVPVTREPDSTFVREDALKFYPEGMTGLEYAVYELPDLTALPGEVTVTDPRGGVCEVRYDAQTNAYTAGPAYRTDLAEEYGAFVVRAVEGYAAYMQRVPGSGFARFRDCFDPDSSLYRAISDAASALWMVRQPTGNRFRDVQTGEFLDFGNGVISCHLSLVQELTRNGREWSDAVDMYLFLHETNGGMRIYQWYNND